MARRRHLVIRAFNTRPPGTTLRDQFFAAGGGDGGDGVSGLGSRRYLTRADVEAALRLEPGSDRSERLLGACFPSRQGSGGWVDAEAFVDWLEHGRTPGPPPILPARSLTLVVVRRPPRSEGASMDSSSPREPLLLPDSDNLEHPLRRRPHWRKREVVVEDRLVEYTTVDADGAAQSLVERERTVTEVVHWDAPNTGEAAHRERIRYQQRETFDGVETGASAGEEEYVHVVNAEQEVFESLRSSLPDQYYDGRAPEQEGEQPQPQQQHRRQRSQRGQRQEQEHEQGGEEGAGEERGRSLSPPMEGWI